MKRAQRKLEKALDGLGRTPDEIAVNLLKMQFYGIRTNCHECPIARFVDNTVGGHKLTVSTYSTFMKRNRKMAVRHPAPVADFVMAFDGGKYPWLAVGSSGYSLHPSSG